MKDKTQYEALMEELQKIVENFRVGVTEIGERFAKLLPDIEIYEEEEEDTWEMKCPYKVGDEYWFIFDNGHIDIDCWEGHATDFDRFKTGNAYPTEETAELEAKRRNLLTRFRAFRNECNEDWKSDCKDVTQKKHYVSYSEIKNSLYVSYIVLGNHLHIFGYFKNEKDAERAIDLFGDEIKELFVECD